MLSTYKVLLKSEVNNYQHCRAENMPHDSSSYSSLPDAE